MRLVGTLILVFNIFLRPAAQEIAVQQLTCAYAETPLGIDVPHPVLGWELWSAAKNKMQSAYELIVSNEPAAIEKGIGNVWKTGKIKSGNSIGVPYNGASLQSFTRYYWKVRVYDEKGRPSPWSVASWFETALLTPADWKAEWITDGKSLPVKDADFYQQDPMPVFRKNISVTRDIKSARLYIAGAGYFEAYLNGEKISSDLLSPAWTRFDKRILYRTYDITQQLKKGNNVAGILLGNGWYNPLPLRLWGKLNLRDYLPVGRPVVKAQYRIVYTDGTVDEISTDSNWRWKEGPVMTNSVYLGESFDARRDLTAWLKTPADSTGYPAVPVAGPEGKLEADQQPPIRIGRIIKPVAIYNTGHGKWVADMGENFAGVARIKVNASGGTKISLRYGEAVYKDGSVNGMTAVAGQIKQGNGGPGAPEVAYQEDHFIASGNGIETWNPRFTFHVFRYVEITGWPGTPTADDIEGLQMNAAIADAGAFECSNPLLNKIQENTLRTFKSNLFSVQSDCAGREKFGYGGDLFCTLESFSYNFNMHNFYQKSLKDFEDSQRPLGGITETAPFVGLDDKGPGDRSGPLGWQIGFPYLIKKLYDFYGDRHILETYYPALTRQIRFLRSRAKENLYYQDISDHESLDEKPEALTASLFYFHHVQLMATFAQLLEKKEEAEQYGTLAAQIKEAILRKFYKGNGVFDNNTPAAALFPLWYGIVEGKEKQLAEKQLDLALAKRDNHITTGIFATKMLFDVLRRADKNGQAYTIASRKDFPGWGYMIANGATTLWETWKYSDNVYSQNHPMFGSITEWFYRSLLGINSTAPGFSAFIIKPQPVHDLEAAKGFYNTLYGKIVSNWQWKDSRFTLKVTVPVNTVAAIWIPSDGEPVFIDGVKIKESSLKKEQGYRVYTTGSGTYTFRSTLKK
ncbi:alpha-L-rhamnosidase [Niabella ginsenosidivorans]|uniref:alpha-L-rhamnosidase n=1 Tax=Niabella ginsenosidivorans TaxID=1176587 RepID=A0A1A9I4T1_9BACT|nr:alpha-L-rhamnosidase [Niabella ginsenosidivorans]ANH82563.1 alpha-L-rhamnosidase [Niabella ginsenosidivorans]